MAEECTVMVGRDVPGDQWIAASQVVRDLWLAEVWGRFLQLMPANLLSWVREPAERCEVDESARRVRLVVEGRCLVPDVVGHEVGPL